MQPIMLALLSAALLAATSPTHPATPTKHRRGCNSTRCDHHADAAYGRHHPLPRRPSSLMVASFFGGGEGACGGGSWGVASKTIACGTRMRICAARCVETTITDRGPYIAGRELDLTTDVANAVGAAPWSGGFSIGAGVGTVRVTIGR